MDKMDPIDLGNKFPVVDQPSQSTEQPQGQSSQPRGPRERSRPRSFSINFGSTSPFEVPVTDQETRTASLIQEINRNNEAEVKGKKVSSWREDSIFENTPRTNDRRDTLKYLVALRAYTGFIKKCIDLSDLEQIGHAIEAHGSAQGPEFAQRDYRAEYAVLLQEIRDIELIEDIQHGNSNPARHPKIFPKRRKFAEDMNYQNYLDSPAAGPSNPRQAPPSPSQNTIHTNGMNSGGTAIGGMVGFPTPAGHQSDLNHIMGMVDELSRQLAQNQQITANVVDKIGKVREKASTLHLTNDELIAMVSQELNDDTANLEKQCAELRKQLEKSDHDKDENWKLAIHGCNILADVLEKTHQFKEKHEIDTLAWHKNYRKQLADEREENLALRNQILDMKAAAARAQEWLRKMRRALTDDEEMHELRVENIAFRQEKRFWKRMALKHLPDDDSEFSDDDDIIDSEEKKQVLAEEAAKKAKEAEGGSADGGEGQASA